MEWDAVAPMIVSSLLIVTTGGVLVLRPIAKRLGDLLEVMTRERLSGDREERIHMRELFETMNQRLSLLEDRQDFTERLIDNPETRPASVTAPSKPSP